ncbi:hypothetical protein WK99_32980 [Burkholderia ubonensis]|nr:hypothetical protein WK99_32980 [Burkholderia ubonensis]
MRDRIFAHTQLQQHQAGKRPARSLDMLSHARQPTMVDREITLHGAHAGHDIQRTYRTGRLQINPFVPSWRRHYSARPHLMTLNRADRFN